MPQTIKKQINKDINLRTFEECLNIIDKEIEKRRYKWTLTSVPHISYEDVAQVLRLHIWKKWALFDQSKSLLSWVNTVISHQIINLLRNNYSNYSRPCLKCEFNEGGDLCRKYGTQNTICPLFREWVHKGKKSAHDIKMPVSMENHQNEVYDLRQNHIDIEKSADLLHKRMKEVLTPLQWKVYNYLFIEHKTERETAKLIGYVSRQQGNTMKCKQLYNVKKIIIEKVKECYQNQEVDIV